MMDDAMKMKEHNHNDYVYVIKFLSFVYNVIIYILFHMSLKFN